MEKRIDSASQAGDKDEVGEGLRQALLRLTSPHYAPLRAEVEALNAQVSAIEKLLQEIQITQSALGSHDEVVDHRAQELEMLIDQAKSNLDELQVNFKDQLQTLESEANASTSHLRGELEKLQSQLTDPKEVSGRVSPVLIPLIAESVRQDQVQFAEAVAPVIGPAIRHQIRDAKQDIIDAMYPLIGEIIGKAVAEAIRDLARKIDASLRRQLNFRQRLRMFFATLRGVSETDFLMRTAMPYSINHVFLIHRVSGLLVKHSSAAGEEAEYPDLISGMLTAIRDFVRDSFGSGVGELEEIAYGEQRILLEAGHQVYLAVVMDGVEPSGYHQLMRNIIAELHVHHEVALRNFDGDLDQLSDFDGILEPLIAPDGHLPDVQTQVESISANQKWLLVGGAAAVLILLAFLALACVFTVRLWPLVFPGA
jgi:hypothetical protein